MTPRPFRPARLPHLALAGLCMAVAACGGGAGGTSEATGQLTLNVTDAPVDQAARVVVEFTGVAVKAEGRPEQTFHYCEEAQVVGPPVLGAGPCRTPAPRQIDLLALHGGASERLLSDVVVPAGRYQWLRLMVGDDQAANGSYIELKDGSVHPLHIPSGDQTGLKLVRGFTVPDGGQAAFTIDFDLRRSVLAPPTSGSPYRLRPTLRLVDNAEAGTVAGSVAPGLLQDASCSEGNAVYVYPGTGAAPVDVNPAGGPVSTARVELDTASGQYVYTAAFLAPGEYTLALTCQAADDDPQTAEGLVFLATGEATVAAAATTAYDFD